jgi:formylglycine-generating enzyme required for sulfatase activity
MKFLPSLFFALLTLNGFATITPEPIQLKTKVIRPLEWYAEQAAQWKMQVMDRPTSEGWLNYYLASRYAQADKSALQEITETINKVAPATYEAYLIKGWEHGYTEEGFGYVRKAFALDQNQVAAFPSMLLGYEFELDNNRRRSFSMQMQKTGMVAESLLTYCYNVLMSLDENAILFCEGENTTVPLFLLQDVFGIRQDVRILNLDMMLSSSYRERKLSSLGLTFSGLNSESELENKKLICSSLPEQNPSEKFYYSLTVTRQNTTEIKDQLYVVGLASQISKTRLDNIATIKANLENRFLLDKLTVDFDGEPAESAGKVLSANYLVPMLLLAEHYQQTGAEASFQKWEGLIMKLAELHDKTVVVNNFLKKHSNDNAPFVAAGINVKTLEPSFKHVKDNVYAMKNELTLDDYGFFLNYLQKNNMLDVYERSKIDLSQYDEPAISFMKAYHNRHVTKNEKEAYPIVNISYEGAVAYCEWLTEQYNHDSKRKYKKVEFRLPSVNEWQIAALGYKNAQSWVLSENTVEMAKPVNSDDEICKNCPVSKYNVKDADIRYPWYYHYNYRNKAINKRGCALGNFKFPETMKPCMAGRPGFDGFILMAFVEAFFPNGIGLYDVVGNVAEMTSEKGKACGGSWTHSPEESTISSVNEYKGPDSAVGFRPFMEVIEQ